MIRIFMFKELENFKKFTKLRENFKKFTKLSIDFEKLDDKLII